MTESKNTCLPEQGEIDRTKIKGYSLRIVAFTSWVKENGYTTSQIKQLAVGIIVMFVLAMGTPLVINGLSHWVTW